LKDDNCLEESNFITKRLIGKEPNYAEVGAWYVGTALTHWVVSRALDNHPKMKKIWEYVSIGAVGYTVYDNHDKGMRPFGVGQDNNNC